MGIKRILIALALLLAAFPSRAQRTASNPLGAQLNVQDAGTCSTTNSFAWQVLPANAATTIVNLSGTFSGTLTIRLSNNGGGSWTTNSTTTTAGNTSVATNGFTDICADVTTFTSGTFQVSISTGLNLGPQGPPGAGAALPNTPLPAATSGPGPVFNVKNYGTSITGTSNISNNCTISGSTNLNCTDANFTSANLNNRVSCGSAFATILAVTTISAIVNATNVTVAVGSGNASGTCLWGPPDDAAVSAANTAMLAAAAGTGQGQALSKTPAAPCLYFPAGTYNLLNTSINIAPAAGGASGFCIIGDVQHGSRVTWNAGSAPSAGQAVSITGNVQHIRIENITFDGISAPGTFSIGAVYSAASDTVLRNVFFERLNSNGFVSQGTVYANHMGASANSGAGFACIPCSGEVYESLFTNNQGAGVLITGVSGANGGAGLRITNSLADENTGNGGCDVQVGNSNDVWFQGFPIFSSTGAGLCSLSVDANSFLHYDGGTIGVFASESNRGGAIISPGGTLEAHGVHFIATGTQKCIQNSGTFRDNGGNTCESQFPIASGTSTGTAAVLTVTPVGANANANCSVGDSLYVRGSGIGGYNGYFPLAITAVTATTISYTTQGSNLGALGAGGTADCLNLQGYSGTLPVAMLNNPVPNTCYVTITPITNATTFNMCNWGAGQATNITRITASSQVVTTCATAPIVTISNGTVSQTLTLTSGKQFWDSFKAQDVSSGVGSTIFKPSVSATGTDRITLKYDAGALSSCVTPPTNLAVSYTITPIMGN